MIIVIIIITNICMHCILTDPLTTSIEIVFLIPFYS